MLENPGGIATAVCALPRNDMVFRQSEVPSAAALGGEGFFTLSVTS